MKWPPSYFAPRYFGAWHFSGGTAMYWPPAYFAARYFAPRYWPGAVGNVEGTFRVDGAATLAWSFGDDDEARLTVSGTSSWLFAGLDVGDPEAFRINGAGSFAFRLADDRFRIAGGSRWRWIASVGVADECLTADGESEGGSGEVKNYVF